MKKLKTLQLRETSAALQPSKKQTAAELPKIPSTTTTTVTVHAEEDDAPMAHDGSPELAASERRLNSVNAAKVQMMKAALFDDEMAEEGETGDDDDDDSDDMEVTFNARSMAAIAAAAAAEAASVGTQQQQPAAAAAKSRPVILEARSTVLEKRHVDPLIEDIAHSVLTGGAGKGLGGSFSMDASSSAATAAAAMSNNLLRNR